VGDHADGRSGTMQVAQQIHNGFAIGRIEIPGRLVGKQNGGISYQRPRHCDALLLAA
jgi:hypothetical protein